MNAQRRATTPPGRLAEVVTSSVRPECLDGIAFTKELNISPSFGRNADPGTAECPARETRLGKAAPMAARLFGGGCPSAPNLSGFPGTGAILF
jgi:hypothetical protein